MKVAQQLADRQRPHPVRRRRRRPSSPMSTSSAKAASAADGRLTNFRRGVTRYPIPGLRHLSGHRPRTCARIFAADDSPHVEIGTVYPTDDIRGALYVDPMLSKHFAILGIDRHRQVDLGRADPSPHLAAIARRAHRDDRSARRIFGGVQELRRIVQRRQSAAALLAAQFRRTLRSPADHRRRRAPARRRHPRQVPARRAHQGQGSPKRWARSPSIRRFPIC